MSNNADVETFDEETIYDVKLARKIEHGSMTYRPLNRYEMRGRFLNKLIAEHGAEVVDYVGPVA